MTLHLRLIFLFLCPAVISQTLARPGYNLEDLEILSQQKEYRELLQHAKHIAVKWFLPAPLFQA